MRKLGFAFVMLGLGLVAYFYAGDVSQRQDSAINDTGKESSAMDSRMASDNRGAPSVLIDASSLEADDGANAETSEIFRSITPELRARYELVVRDRFFRNGEPHLYRQHDIVEIDTEALKQQLEGSLSDDGQVSNSVTIPLLGGAEVKIAVDKWTNSDLGVAAAFGHAVDVDNTASHVEFYFSDNGRLEASLVLGNDAYIVSDVGDYTYYMIMQMDTFQGEVD